MCFLIEVNLNHPVSLTLNEIDRQKVKIYDVFPHSLVRWVPSGRFPVRFGLGDLRQNDQGRPPPQQLQDPEPFQQTGRSFEEGVRLPGQNYLGERLREPEFL